MTPRVLAVADSDSYLKWAAATLVGLGLGLGLGSADRGRAGRPERDGSGLVLVASPVLPSAVQIDAALAGTGLARPEVVRLGALVRRLRQDRPEVLVVACTGPTARVVLALASRVRPRPVTVVGLPGWALPASAEAVRLRRGADVFVVHSRAERAAHARLVARLSPGTRTVLARLPFLSAQRGVPGVAVGAGGTGGAAASPRVRRVVFAPQALVPATRADRERLLDGLVALAADGFEVVVKLRGRARERQTHDERWPLDALAAARPDGGARLRFETGPLAAWLGPGSALVTVSSTAALEGLASGVPVALLDDFGVRDELINTAFRGSGLLVGLGRLAGVLSDGGPVPDPAWLADHGLHPDPSELPGALGEAVGASVGAPGLQGPSDLRALARLLVPARVAQSVRRA